MAGRFALVDSTRWPEIDEGAYSVIFCNHSTNVIIKQFRHLPENHRVRDVFNSEISAYEIASRDPTLMTVTPRFYGTTSVSAIVDCHGNDISEHFRLDLAYTIDYLPGRFVKITQTRQMAEEIADLFRAAGINYVCDASVAELADGTYQVIDFAIEGFEIQAN